MPSFTAREVRTWAAQNGHACPDKGRVPKDVIDAYLLDVHGVDVGDHDHPDTPPPADEPAFRVTIEIPGDEEAGDQIAQYVLEAVWIAYEAGRRAERARILASLG